MVGRRAISRGRALLDDAAAFDDDELVGQHDRLDRVVGDQQARPGEVGQVRRELGPDVEAGSGVERGQRLVQQQHARAPGQRPGQCDPLCLAAGQLGRLAVGQVGQPEPRQPVIGRCRGVRAGLCPATRGENATFSATVRCGKSR